MTEPRERRLKPVGAPDPGALEDLRLRGVDRYGRNVEEIKRELELAAELASQCETARDRLAAGELTIGREGGPKGIDGALRTADLCRRLEARDRWLLDEHARQAAENETAVRIDGRAAGTHPRAPRFARSPVLPRIGVSAPLAPPQAPSPETSRSPSPSPPSPSANNGAAVAHTDEQTALVHRLVGELGADVDDATAESVCRAAAALTEPLLERVLDKGPWRSQGEHWQRLDPAERGRWLEAWLAQLSTPTASMEAP